MSSEVYLPYRSMGGYLAVPLSIRERHHITEEDAKVQAIGPSLQLTLPAEEGRVTIRLSLIEWQQSRPYDRACTAGGYHIERWEDLIEVEDGFVHVLIEEWDR